MTVSTLNPTVGIVFTDWPSFSLYSMVVFPAASNPSIKILISLFPNTLDRIFPMLIKLLLNLWTNNGWIEENLKLRLLSPRGVSLVRLRSVEQVGVSVTLRNYILTILLQSVERHSTEAHFRDLLSFLKEKSYQWLNKICFLVCL